MSNLPPFFSKDFSGGMATNVNESIAPRNTVALGLNVDFDEEIGSATSRLGTSTVASQLVDGQAILGLHDFQDSDASNHALLAAVNAAGGATSVIYKVGTGTIATGLTASLTYRFITFLDSVLIINGTDAPRSYDGATVITTGGAFDLANIPFAEPSLCIEWLDRVYLAGDTANPDRLYYSSTPSSGAVSWTTDNGFIDVEPEDGGGGITALSKVSGFLLIFKERSMKRWNFDSAFPETLVEIGTPAQESVISAGGLCAFFSASNKDARGFYITNGDRPVAISHDRGKNLKKFIDAIPQAAEAAIAGIGTERVLMWSVGDLTVDGETYPNVVFRYNRKLDQWSIRSYPTQIKHFSPYVSSGVNEIVAGDEDGTIIYIDKDDTYTDWDSSTGAAIPIHYKLHLQEEKFGYNQIKELAEKVIWDTKNAIGSRSVVFVDGKRVNEGGSSGMLSRLLEFAIKKTLRGRYFTFGIEGSTDGARAYIKECEVPNITVVRNTKQ